ncbi:MAG: hypothetical protein EA366_10825 [Spirulina sp. DLM2.Bin59]|nr:MAG: hypothetical protein EA366_10825 [Spirulina sp. DLM2.Bin59]
MKISRIVVFLLATLFVSSALVACDDSTETRSPAEEPQEEVVEEEETEEAEAFEAVNFTLVNATNRPLIEFYVAHPEEEEWGKSLIPDGTTLAPGSQANVIIDDGRPDCEYDIMGVLGAAEDGSVGEGELIHSGVEICDGTIYTYSAN